MRAAILAGCVAGLVAACNPEPSEQPGPALIAPATCLHVPHWVDAAKLKEQFDAMQMEPGRDQVSLAIGELIDLRKQIDAAGLACPVNPSGNASLANRPTP